MALPRPVGYPALTPTPEDDGLVDKYRVFRELDTPQVADNHPVIMRADFLLPPDGTYVQAEEVRAFVFVLKPNNDHHARVALAAYAASCSIEKPQLSKDLYDLLSQDEWGEG